MVKIEEKSLKEKAYEEKYRTMLTLSEKIAGNRNIISKPDDLCILLYGGNISVFPDNNSIRVYKPKLFDMALRLAETYEKHLKEEITLRK